MKYKIGDEVFIKSGSKRLIIAHIPVQDYIVRQRDGSGKYMRIPEDVLRDSSVLPPLVDTPIDCYPLAENDYKFFEKPPELPPTKLENFLFLFEKIKNRLSRQSAL